MAKFTWQDGTLVSKAKVEVGGTIYEVDPEEYSGATPLSAGNLNAMQDGIYDDLGNKNQLKTMDKTDLVSAINSIVDTEVYSTSEIKTNKVWIDGKPIYRKVIEVGHLPNDQIVQIPHNIANFGESIDVRPRWYDTVDSRWLNTNRVDSNQIKIEFSVHTTYIEIGGLGTNWDYRTRDCTVVLEYTKTTD